MIVNAGPKLERISSEAIGLIHQASLQILEEVGVVFTCNEAIEILEATPGTRVDRDAQRVWFDRALVERSLSQCPASFSVLARDPAKSITIGGDSVCFLGDGGQPFVQDRERGRRVGTLADLVEGLKILHSLPRFDTVGKGGHIEPQDVDTELRAVARAYIAAKYTDKPAAGFTFWGRASAEDGLTVARILHDGVDLSQQAVCYSNVNPISPLLWDERQSEGIIVHARARQPMIFSPAVMAGITGPMTLAGSMAQQNAEALSGIVLAQAVQPGAPCILGCVTTVSDMKVGAPVYGSPEHALCSSISAQLARRYGIPSRSGTTCTESKLPDTQAGIEHMMNALIAVQSGQNLILAAGYLDSYLTASYEMLVLMDDVIGMVSRFVEGIVVDEAALALDVIREVGPQGMFLTTEHTYTYFRGSYFEPTIAERRIYAEWVKHGSKSAEERATERWKQLLATYQAPPLDPAKERAIIDLIRRRPGGDDLVTALSAIEQAGVGAGAAG